MLRPNLRKNPINHILIVVDVDLFFVMFVDEVYGFKEV